MSRLGQPHATFHEQFARVTTIQYELNDEQMFGTGFYFKDNGDYYLVTNRHILRHEFGISSDSIRYRDSHNLANVKSHRECLFDLVDNDEKQARWFEHNNTEGQTKADVAVLPIDLDLTQTGSSAYSPSDYLPANINLKGGNASTVIGYPYEVLDYENYFPMMRHAVLASPYGVYYNGNGCFVIDSMQQPGSSGSPVITSPSHLYEKQDGTRIYGGESLLGIHSGGVIDEENVGLYRVWYAEWIEALLNDAYRPVFELS